MGTYDIEMEMKADLEDLAQLSVTVYIDNIVKPLSASVEQKASGSKRPEILASSLDLITI